MKKMERREARLGSGVCGTLHSSCLGKHQPLRLHNEREEGRGHYGGARRRRCRVTSAAGPSLTLRCARYDEREDYGAYVQQHEAGGQSRRVVPFGKAEPGWTLPARGGRRVHTWGHNLCPLFPLLHIELYMQFGKHFSYAAARRARHEASQPLMTEARTWTRACSLRTLGSTPCATKLAAARSNCSSTSRCFASS